jgi:CheY-like chemotaxis protein
MIDPAAKTILVVDDDSDAREALGELLTLRGYNVACAENGRAALEKIRALRVPPALILLDLCMPVMDGFAFLRRAREDLHIRSAPIIVITSHPLVQPYGADATLRKPIKFDRLISMVRRFVNKSQDSTSKQLCGS